MARVTGLEPATSGVTGRRSNQLSYTRIRPRLVTLRREGVLIGIVGVGVNRVRVVCLSLLAISVA